MPRSSTGLDREGVHVTKAAKRIAELGGVEATYEWMVAAEEGQAVSGAEGGDEEMESEGCSISGELPASREVDAKAHGEPISPTETNIERAVGNDQSIPSFDPERSLIVELEGADLERVLDAGDAAEGPARWPRDHCPSTQRGGLCPHHRPSIRSVGKPVNEPLPKGSAGRRTPRGPGLQGVCWVNLGHPVTARRNGALSAERQGMTGEASGRYPAEGRCGRIV